MSSKIAQDSIGKDSSKLGGAIVSKKDSVWADNVHLRKQGDSDTDNNKRI